MMGKCCSTNSFLFFVFCSRNINCDWRQLGVLLSVSFEALQNSITFTGKEWRRGSSYFTLYEIYTIFTSFLILNYY